MDKISIVTVTRNAAPLLKHTMENVAKQTYPDLEYLVIDGASDDESIDIVSNSSVVNKWVSEPDKGIYDAMNKGARLSSGEWILFMNAGDSFASPETVATLMNFADNHPEADVIYGDVIRCNSDGSEVLKVATDELKGHRLAFCHQSVMCRRRLLLETPFDISHRYSADFKFFKTLAATGKSFAHVNIPVARFDTTGISTTNRAKGLADNMKVIREVDGIVKGFPSILHLLPTYLLSRLRSKK